MRRFILLAIGLTAVVACATEPAGTTTTTTTAQQTTSTVAEGTTTTQGGTTTSSGVTTTIPGDADHELFIEGFSFSGPATVSVGDTILVTNDDRLPHTWTSTDGGWTSGTLSPGRQFFHVFEEAGTFEYFCGIHAEMRGSITVAG